VTAVILGIDRVVPVRRWCAFATADPGDAARGRAGSRRASVSLRQRLRERKTRPWPTISHPCPAGSRSSSGRFERARRSLLELWRRASPADRLFAVDRLLRETVLEHEVSQRLHAVQDAVRDAWATARVAAHLKDSVPADAGLASLQLSLVERDRDVFLENNGLFDRVFVAAESYFRDVPMIQGAPTLKTLLNEREIARAALVPILPPLEDDARIA